MFRPTLTAFAATLVLAVPAFSNDTIKAQNSLTRPPGAPDSDASGFVRAEIDLSKNRHKLTIEAEHIDTSLTFDCFIEDGVGTLTNVGTLEIDDINQVELEFDSKDGPPLPFGTVDVHTLAGRGVEVRSAGVTYLSGVVPSLDGSGGGGGGGGSGNTDKAKSFLVHPPSAPDANASGYVEIRNKGGGDQRFKVEIDHIDILVDYTIWVETTLGSGIFANVGTTSPQLPDEAELEIETEGGAALPNGATDVTQLTGLHVEVHDATSAIILTGIVPSLTGSATSDDGKAHDKFTGSGGKAKFKLENKGNNQEFELEIEHLLGSASVNLFIFDGAALTQVATIALNSKGKGKYKVDTEKGQALPLDVASLSDLGGKAFEIRDALSSVVLVTGTIPQL